MLTGERVLLRPTTPDDVEPLWRARLDPLTGARTQALPLVPQTLRPPVARPAPPCSAARARSTRRPARSGGRGGSVEEGRLREAARVEGAYDDVVLMARLRG